MRSPTLPSSVRRGARTPGRQPTAPRSVCSIQRCLIAIGFIYFQLSTFALVQWMREHGSSLVSRPHGSSSTQAVNGMVAPDGTDLSAFEVASSPPAQQQQQKRNLSPPPASAQHLPPPSPPAASPRRQQRQQSAQSQHTAPSRHTRSAVHTPQQQHKRPQLLPVLGGGDEAANDDEAPEDGDGAAAAGLDDSSVRAQLGEGLDGLDGLGPAGAGGEVDGGEVDGGADGDGAARPAPKLSAWIESDLYGKFMGITTFFNPGRHQNKVDNFRKFRASVASQGLQLLCVELVFGEDTPFQLRGENEDAGGGGADGAAGGEGADGDADGETPARADCDILIGKRTTSDNTLWQKERLLNIALENLPRTVDKVMWLDSDLIFLNDDWVPETAELLDKYPVVQPFAWMTYLPASEGASYATEQLPTLPLGQGVGGVYHGAGLGLQSFPDMCFRSNFLLGHPGFAWAARREVMEVAGFYDRSIIGGGDRIMLNAFTGHYVGVSKKMPPAMAEDVRAFGRKFTPLVGPSNVSYTPGIVLHIWHGNRADRDYTHRYQILLLNRYDPVNDVRVNKEGVLAWSTDKPRLHRQVTEYFNNRKEGPKPNKSATGSQPAKAEGDDVWTAQRKSLSRPVRSFLGYHCGRPDYRASCKVAFRLWGDTLRATQLQILNKKLREQQEAAKVAMAASREATQKRTRGKRKAMRERKAAAKALAN